MGSLSVYRQLKKFETDFLNRKLRSGTTTLAMSQISNTKIEMITTGDGKYIPDKIMIVRVEENIFVGHITGSDRPGMDLATLKYDHVEERS